jgi:multidrug efflux pump subunit AcrA (membrane-fusion protein)
LPVLLLGVVACDAGTSADVLPPSREELVAERFSEDVVSLSEDAVRRIGLRIVSVEEREVPVEIAVSGRVMPNADRTVRVASYIAGIVTECCKSVGDQVGRGETLTVLHTHQTHDLLAEYRTAVAEFRASQSEWELAGEAFRRESRLLDLKVGSVARVQAAENALTRAESAVESADATVEAAIAHLEYLVHEVPAAIRNRESGPVPDFDVAVRAPIAGTIISRAITQGDVVTPTAELYRISDLSRLWVIAQVPEERLAELSVGMEASVRVRAYPDRTFQGSVARIASNLDPETRTVQLRCEVENSDVALKTGMYASIVLRANVSQPTLVVPESAVQYLGEDAFVFLPRGNGRFQKRPITVGRSVNSTVEVLTGLSVRDQVVGHGSFLLKAEMLKSEMAAQ